MRSDPANEARKKALMAVGVTAVLFVVMPFLTWHQTWFGRQLSNRDIERYLNDSTRPRYIQHALAQIGERMSNGDGEAARWYPRVVSAAHNSHPEIRNTAAWVMGNDPKSQVLHAALLDLLSDRDLAVRRNAALALVRFGDNRGRGELVSILQPRAVRAGSAGVISLNAAAGQEVRRGAAIARVTTSAGQVSEVRAPESGRVATIAARDRSPVAADTVVLTLISGDEEIWEALRGLYLIGVKDDLAAVEEVGAAAGLAERIRQQASLTASAIRMRPEPSPSR